MVSATCLAGIYMEHPIPGALVFHRGPKTPFDEPTLGATSSRLAALFPGEGEFHRGTESEAYGQLYSAGALENPSPLTGRLELYPTWMTNTGEFNSQNLYVMNLKIGETTSLEYDQYWNTNIYKPSAPSQGLNPYLWEGMVGFRFKDVYKDNDGLNITVLQRVLLPTYYAERDAGLIAGWESEFLLKKDLNKVLTFVVEEEPFLLGYRRSGYNGSPNPILTNLFVLELDFNITKRLTATFPIQLITNRYRPYSPGTPFNDAWQNFVQLWPSINYQLIDNLSVGIYWLSDSFVKPNFSGFTPANAFRNGALQFNTTVSF